MAFLQKSVAKNLKHLEQQVIPKICAETFGGSLSLSLHSKTVKVVKTSPGEASSCFCVTSRTSVMLRHIWGSLGVQHLELWEALVGKNRHASADMFVQEIADKLIAQHTSAQKVGLKGHSMSTRPALVRKTREGWNCRFQKTPRTEGGDNVPAVRTQGSRQVCLSRCPKS